LQFIPVIGSRELEGKVAKELLALGMTSEIGTANVIAGYVGSYLLIKRSRLTNI
jgi:hypothetical protein